MAREMTGLKSQSGQEIREGDIVRFKVDYDHYLVPHYDTPNGTEMTDVVKIIDGVIYFWDENFGGSFAFRHAPHCEIVGSIYLKEEATNV